MILMYHNTLDLNHIVGLLLVAFVWVLIKKPLCLKAWAEFLIASMYITQTSKEIKYVFNREHKGELWNVYSHTKWHN